MNDEFLPVRVTRGLPSRPVKSPNDTRYPTVAIVSGLVSAAAVGGALFALPIDWEPWRAVVAPVVTALTAALVGSSIKFADQWEKAVVLRLGRYRGLRGPGLFYVIPVVDRIGYHIDQRIRTTDFGAESCLTKDTVPVNVDAIAFWMVWDAKKSVLEVENFETAVTLSAQTGLRDSIGRHELGDMLSHRDRLGKEIQQVLDAKTNAWGITVQSVEIRDIIIPKELEDAMSRQAQAERERQSRIILSKAEMEIAASFEKASEHYQNNPVALHLRAMNMVFEGLKKKGSMIIVPSTAVETMGLGAMGGLTAFDRILGSDQGSAETTDAPEDSDAKDT